MGYTADVTVDLTFRDPTALARYLTTVPWFPGGGDPRDPAWAIVADFSEYAHATLDGLHLTGHGSGRLLTGYTARVAALARYADGVIDVVAEDGTRWRARLDHGTATPETSTGPDPLREAAIRCPDPDLSPRARRAGAGVGR